MLSAELRIISTTLDFAAHKKQIRFRPMRIIRTLMLLAALLAATDASRAADEKSIEHFRDAIVKLGPSVNPAEAQVVSETAHQTARRLQREWRVVPFAL